MLRVEDLHVYYGGIHALRGISFQVPEKTIVTLIGANGAGKSSTLRCISGVVKPRAGHVWLDGKDIAGMASHAIVEMGIALVPEGRKMFANLTVLENLLVGAHARDDHAAVSRDLGWVLELFPILAERQSQGAGTLSGGEQQMLAVARALMSKPRLLLMDEPSLGLAPLLVREIFRTIQYLHEQGTTILLVEQNARAALQVADHGYILETGQIVLEGPGLELAENDAVR
jgi:branched-chain amino acid transport system ATP-binding protein